MPKPKCRMEYILSLPSYQAELVEDADPVPMEAAVLEPEADSMKQLVRNYVEQLMADREEDVPLELENLVLGEEEPEAPLSPYELDAEALDMAEAGIVSLEDPLPGQEVDSLEGARDENAGQEVDKERREDPASSPETERSSTQTQSALD